MKKAMNIIAIVLGFMLGNAVVTYAQSPGGDGTQSNPYKITQTGGWNKVIKCVESNVALTISIDGAAAVPAAGVTWQPSGDVTAPFAATIPQSQMPAAIRVVGTHSLAITTPATTITLADGSPYTYPSATYTEFVKTFADLPSSVPPKDGGWKKIAGTIVLASLGVLAWILSH